MKVKAGTFPVSLDLVVVPFGRTPRILTRFPRRLHRAESGSYSSYMESPEKGYISACGPPTQDIGERGVSDVGNEPQGRSGCQTCSLGWPL